MLEKSYLRLGSLQKIADESGWSIDTICKYSKIFKIEYLKSNHAKKYLCNENIFEEDNEKSFYLAGFIAADGCVMKRKHGQSILKISLAIKDLQLLEKINTLLESTNMIKQYVTKYEYCELRINSDKICNDLKRFNIVPRKTFIYEMPQWLIDHKSINHFMRGYFDGDGCIQLNKNKQLCFSILGTEKFTNQYQKILIDNCNLNKTKIVKYKNIFRNVYCGNVSAGKIYNFLYKDATIYLDRKKILFNNTT